MCQMALLSRNLTIICLNLIIPRNKLRNLEFGHLSMAHKNWSFHSFCYHYLERGLSIREMEEPWPRTPEQ